MILSFLANHKPPVLTVAEETRFFRESYFLAGEPPVTTGESGVVRAESVE
jgi:hypothetical protein